MSKNLLIVESPAKAKTIEGYLGADFLVKSSYGHIRDLAKGDDAIDINNDFAQRYEVPEDKRAVVSELQRLAKKAETVWLASDEDREGEAISWHLLQTLNLDESKTKRIVFHEITKPAILKAISNPRSIDYDLVHAQQARRVLDRLVGFELSPILWKKVKPQLSAGRVQSVAVRLIVEREREINRFNAEGAFKIIAVFSTDGKKNNLKAELPQRFNTEPEAEKFLQNCIGADFKVNSLEVKPGKRTPAAPFTTSTLQQEASRKLGFSVARTMQVAQRLYEAGKITYMRTDSVNLSDTALNAAEAEIKTAYGDQYHTLRRHKNKNTNAQEAHEAIRPTYFNDHTVDGEAAEKRLYELIWKRAIASQMTDAAFERTNVKIGVSTRSEELAAQGEVLKFDGFLKVYMESKDEDEDDTNAEEGTAILPLMEKGQALHLREMTATERFTRPSARYTEASLVKKMEELGIGRPSTYAPTISTIQKRGYVIREDREGKQRNFRVLELKEKAVVKKTEIENFGAEKSKLFPSDIGALVNDFLVQHFENVVDYNFTAKVEKEFDEIAQGLKVWTDMIRAFYNPFHQDVEKTLQTAERVRADRVLGVDPVSGRNITVRIGRFGPFVQIGDTDDEEKPRNASLKTGQRVETITLEESLELFKLPREVGNFEGVPLSVAIGRFGPYVRHDKAFFSLGKEDDPYTIEEARAVELILAKREADANKLIKSFEEDETVKVLNGRWGPYIAFGKQNVKIPKDTEPLSLTFDDCKDLAEKDAAAEKAGTKRKAPAKAKTAAKTPAKSTTAKTAKAKTGTDKVPAVKKSTVVKKK